MDISFSLSGGALLFEPFFFKRLNKLEITGPLFLRQNPHHSSSKIFLQVHTHGFYLKHRQ